MKPSTDCCTRTLLYQVHRQEAGDKNLLRTDRSKLHRTVSLCVPPFFPSVETAKKWRHEGGHGQVEGKAHKNRNHVSGILNFNQLHRPRPQFTMVVLKFMCTREKGQTTFAPYSIGPARRVCGTDEKMAMRVALRSSRCTSSQFCRQGVEKTFLFSNRRVLRVR